MNAAEKTHPAEVHTDVMTNADGRVVLYVSGWKGYNPEGQSDYWPLTPDQAIELAGMLYASAVEVLKRTLTPDEAISMAGRRFAGAVEVMKR